MPPLEEKGEKATKPEDGEMEEEGGAVYLRLLERWETFSDKAANAASGSLDRADGPDVEIWLSALCPSQIRQGVRFCR